MVALTAQQAELQRTLGDTRKRRIAAVMDVVEPLVATGGLAAVPSRQSRR